MTSSLKKPVVASALAVLAVACALAFALMNRALAGAQLPPNAVNSPLDLSTFKTAFKPTATESVDIASLRTVVERMPMESLSKSLSFDSARPVSIPGIKRYAYAVAGQDSFCVFTPRDADFWNSACGTTEDLNKVGMISVSGGSDPDHLIAVVVQLDGSANPTVTSAGGESRAIEATGNIATAVVTSADKISTAGSSFGPISDWK